MTDPLRIPLSTFQQARFAQMRAEAQKIADRQNEAVTTIIAAEHDPATVAGWSIALAETEIVCTPPEAA
jgi:hypothetical protein